MFRCTGICENCWACGDIDSMEILTSFSMPDFFSRDGEKGLGVAIDIGTTTIATALWDLETGIVLDQKAAPNPQRNFGGDIVSRTAFAMKSEENYSLLRNSLINKINSIIGSYFFNIDDFKGGNKDDVIGHLLEKNEKPLLKLALSGNRVMTTILLGHDISSVSKYPYKPRILEEKAFNWDIAIKEGSRVLKGKSVDAYVVSCSYSNIGGDIVAGLMGVEQLKDKSNSLFLDLGTNGECILTTSEGLVGFSAAAGPAFEGGNIRNGVFAQKGAISEIKIENDNLSLEFIGGDKPEKSLGLCGSGLIYSIGQLVKNKLIDKDGRIVDLDYFSRLNPYSNLKNLIGEDKIIILEKYNNKNKEIALYQKDIREFQLAKSAVLSGIRIALDKSNLKAENVDKIVLAGGFGKSITKEALINSGIIPKNIGGELVFVGNSALAGTSLILMMEKYKKASEELAKKIDVIELSFEKNFQKEFLDAMAF